MRFIRCVYIFPRAQNRMPGRKWTNFSERMRGKWAVWKAKAKHASVLSRKFMSPLERRQILEARVLKKFGYSKNSTEGIFINKMIRAEFEYKEMVPLLKREAKPSEELIKEAEEAEKEKLNTYVMLRRRVGWEAFGKILRIIHGLEK
jgi:hypothetical protein